MLSCKIGKIFSNTLFTEPLRESVSVKKKKLCHSININAVQLQSILPSFHPTFRLSGRSLGIVSLVLSRFRHGAGKPDAVVHDSQIFQEKKFSPKNWENGPKLFEFIEKFCH